MEMEAIAQQTKMPRNLKVNGVEVGFDSWLREKDMKITPSDVECVWRKCLAGGLEASPV